MMKKSKQPISITHPLLAAEAHPTKNTDPTRTTDTLTYGSNKRLVWACQVGPHHDYEMAVCDRAILGHHVVEFQHPCADRAHPEGTPGITKRDRFSGVTYDVAWYAD